MCSEANFNILSCSFSTKYPMTRLNLAMLMGRNEPCVSAAAGRTSFDEIAIGALGRTVDTQTFSQLINLFAGPLRDLPRHRGENDEARP